MSTSSRNEIESEDEEALTNDQSKNDVEQSNPDKDNVGETNESGDNVQQTNEGEEPMDIDPKSLAKSAKSSATIDLASLSSKLSLGRHMASTLFKRKIQKAKYHRSSSTQKASKSTKKKIQKANYQPPTSVQQIIDLSQDWLGPPIIDLDQDCYSIPDPDPSIRLFSYSPDIYLDYSPHVPHLS